MPSWPEATKPFTFSLTASSSFFELPGQLDSDSASADALAGSALSAFTTSTQSSADRW